MSEVHNLEIKKNTCFSCKKFLSDTTENICCYCYRGLYFNDFFGDTQ